MRNNKTKRRFLRLLMLVTLSIPLGAFAQGGLFLRGNSEKESQNTVFLRNGEEGITVTNQPFGHFTEGVDVTNQTFGVPIGNGILTLLVAGVGFAALKSNKRNKKSRKENIK